MSLDSLQQKLVQLVELDSEYRKALRLVKHRDQIQKALRDEMIRRKVSGVEVNNGTIHAVIKFNKSTHQRVDVKSIPHDIRDSYLCNVNTYREHLIIYR